MNQNFSLLVLVFLCVGFYICEEVDASFTNFHLTKMENCDDIQRYIKFDFDLVTDKRNRQYLSFNITYPIPVGDNTNFVCLIQGKSVGNNFVDLHTIREKNFCKAMNKYMGEFWYDIERQSLIAPGVCPIQQGIYHAHHVLLQFEKITLQTFPFGTLRFKIEGFVNKNNHSAWCLRTEVENVVN